MDCSRDQGSRTALLAGAALLALLTLACAGASSPGVTPTVSPPACAPDAGGGRAGVEVIGSIPHAGAVWTEGLLLEGGLLWESTGEPTGSGVRALDPGTGDVTWTVSNGEAFFAEGIARGFGRTYVLSLREGTVYTFDAEAAPPFQPFAHYDGEGWGLTAVGDSLVNSNGTSTLFHRDPETFDLLGTAEVAYGAEPVQKLNELEYDGCSIWANQWLTSFVYRIDPGDPGNAVRYELPADFCPEGHPNGIAWDGENGLFYLTGQRCEEILKVRFR